MPDRCCVFQPFDDGGPFDMRFDEILAPAIEAANLEPYRVDRDPSATIPIDKLHEVIQSSSICLADITLDNANVWYELGYAIGRGKSVVIISGKDREKFPFDIQHRRVIRYQQETTSDFKRLEKAVMESLKAEVQNSDLTQRIAEASPLAERAGLPEHEIAVLAFVVANARLNNWTSRLVEDMERAGFTSLATTLALKSLQKKGFLRIGRSVDEDSGVEREAAFLSDRGEEGLITNQDALLQPRLINRKS